MARNQVATKEKQEVVEATSLPAAAQGFLDSSMGNADSESFAIPFLRLLQSNSPECDPDSGAYKPEARKGMILDTVSGELMDAIEIFPVWYQREMIEWVMRNEGGGLVNRFMPEVAPAYEVTDIEGKLIWLMANGHQLVDTRQHYVLYRPLPNVVGDETTEFWKPAVIGMSSSQIKVSKRLMTNIKELRKQRRLLTFRVSTRGESNSKGSWSSWAMGPGQDALKLTDMLEEAQEFQTVLTAGTFTIEGQDTVGEAGPVDNSF